METIELNSFLGSYIHDVCKEAAEKANAANLPVHFVFNDTHVTVQPGESAETATARWQTDFDTAAKAWRESPEYAAREATRAAELRQKTEAHLSETAATEAEMRKAEVPWPYTEKQLRDYITSLVDRQHDYGTCVYAMSMAAVAAFNYVAHQLGVTGFQASCADLDIVRRTRGIKGPFILLNGEDALYPQYDLPGRLQKALADWAPWLKEQAEERLADGREAHPNVQAHWKHLAGRD